MTVATEPNYRTRRCWYDDATDGTCTTVMTRWFEGVGWRCRWHQPAASEVLPSIQATFRDADDQEQPVTPRLPPERPAPTPPPVPKPRTLRHCEILYAWAASELMRGAMTESQAKAIKHMLDGFRMAWKDNKGKKIAQKIIRGLREGK